MDPTLGGIQEGQSQQEQPGGGIKIPLGKISSRVATQALRGFFAFLAANPWIWIIGLIVALSLVVFIIVLSGGSGGVPGAPTEAITPAPAEL